MVPDVKPLSTSHTDVCAGTDGCVLGADRQAFIRAACACISTHTIP